MTLSTTTLGITTLCHYAEGRCAECHVLFIFILNVIMPSVIMLSVVMLNVVMLSVVAPLCQQEISLGLASIAYIRG